MDMKKINKMNVAELELEKVKLEEQLPKLEQVVMVIEKRIVESKEDMVLGDKPRYDIPKLESDLKAAKSSIFEIEKFMKLFDTMKRAADNKERQKIALDRRNQFLAALKRAVDNEIKGKPQDDKDIELIKNIKHQGNVMMFLNKIRLTR